MTSSPARGFPPEERAHGFDNDAAALTVSPALAEAYFHTAVELAAATVARADFTAFLGCDPQTGGEAACAESFLLSFATRAYRRPPAEDDLAVLRGLFATGHAQGGFKEGIRLVIAAVLQAPRFLYRVERGTPLPGGRLASLERRANVAQNRIIELLRDRLLRRALDEALAPGQLHELAAQVASRRRDPYSIVEEIAGKIRIE